MKKFAALLMALVLCLSATAVLAETADYSNVKLASSCCTTKIPLTT